jgi:hypothetical protein
MGEGRVKLSKKFVPTGALLVFLAALWWRGVKDAVRGRS